MRKYLALSALVLGAALLLSSPFLVSAAAVSWDFSSNVLKPLQALLGKPVTVGTSTPQTLTELTVAATSTDTTNVLAVVDRNGTMLFKVLASGTASTSKFQADGLATCNSGSSALTWSGGTFGCNSISASGGAFPFSADTNYGAVVYSTSTPTLWFKLGLYASSTSIFSAINTTYATSTFASSTALTATNLFATNATLGSATGLAITTSGVLSTIAGTTCTNQLLRAFTVSGGTCATVGAADVSLANLTATDATLTFSGTYTGATARTIGLNLSNVNTWTGGQTFGNATTTGTFTIPNGASVITPLVGNWALDTDAGQIRWNDSRGTVNVSATSTKSFNIASTTLDALGKRFNTATSTFLVLNDPRPLTMLGFYCMASTTGTALVRFGDPSGNYTTEASCSTGAYTLTTTNNTWTSFEGMTIQASSTAGAVSRITVTAVLQETAQ